MWPFSMTVSAIFWMTLFGVGIVPLCIPVTMFCTSPIASLGKARALEMPFHAACRSKTAGLYLVPAVTFASCLARAASQNGL